MSRVFLDTNILAYAIDQGVPAKRTASRDLLRDLEPNGVISTQVLQEFYVVATRKLGVDPAAARDIVRLLTNFEVITVTPDLIEQAIDCSTADQLSFWDALIVVAAEAGNCDELWTEDLQHGRVIRTVRVVNPLRPLR